jgi:hypothetical protein
MIHLLYKIIAKIALVATFFAFVSCLKTTEGSRQQVDKKLSIASSLSQQNTTIIYLVQHNQPHFPNFLPAKAIQSSFFGFNKIEGSEIERYIYRLVTGKNIYITDQSAYNALIIQKGFSNSDERDNFNTFVRAFNVHLNNIIMAENYNDELFTLFMGRNIIKSRIELEGAFVTNKAYLPIISTFFQVVYDNGLFNLSCYTSDATSLYHNKLSFNQQGVITSFTESVLAKMG